jgi:hypothetical protein
MSFTSIDANLSKTIAERLERLTKSFTAGYQGLSNAGRTGVSALAVEQLDPVLRSITMTDSQFLLTKDIPTLKSTQTVYQYIVKTAVQSGIDLAGLESFLPQEDTSQYLRVAEVLKVYGIRKSISQMAQFVNDAGGFVVDVEKENDVNAALSMAQALERDLYTGGDYFMTTSGDIDGMAAAQINGPLRQIRGIQANIRAGDKSQRGIPGDFVGYGNSRSVVFNRKGAVLDRQFLDKIATAVGDNMGAIREAHCTTSQLAEFRATFFPLERGNIADMYAIRGAGVTNDEQSKLPIDTVRGTVDFIPTVFKYMRQRPVMITGSVGVPPSTPTVGAPASVGAASGSGFLAGEIYKYRVQAVNISGMSQASAAQQITIGVGDDNKPVDLVITNAAGVEYYQVFKSPKEAAGAADMEMFIGKMIPSSGGTTTFRDNGRIVPGLDSVLFLPRDKNRAKLATLGNLLNKLELGTKGTAFEVIYTSYVGCVVDRPRAFAVSDNVFQAREGL